jgi:hypothetical protein
MIPQPQPETMKKKKPQITQITQIFFVFFSCFSWIIFIEARHECARAFTLRRMKTDTNELAQHIGPPCHGALAAGGN